MQNKPDLANCYQPVPPLGAGGRDPSQAAGLGEVPVLCQYRDPCMYLTDIVQGACHLVQCRTNNIFRGYTPDPHSKGKEG